MNKDSNPNFDNQADTALTRSTYAGSASSQLNRMEADSSKLSLVEKSFCLLTFFLVCWGPGVLLVWVGIAGMILGGLDIQLMVVAMAGFSAFAFGCFGAWLLFRKKRG